MQEEQFGNPFIFSKIADFLKSGNTKEITNEELKNVMIRHINLEVEEKGEYTGIREMRKHLAYYTKGLKNSSAVRRYINNINTKDELVQALTEYFKSEMNI